MYSQRRVNTAPSVERDAVAPTQRYLQVIMASAGGGMRVSRVLAPRARMGDFFTVYSKKRCHDAGMCWMFLSRDLSLSNLA